jgi:hypothetical protein
MCASTELELGAVSPGAQNAQASAAPGEAVFLVEWRPGRGIGILPMFVGGGTEFQE